MLHLWFGRRASIRLRQALMAAIYDKALKRKDFSGVVKKDDPGEKNTVKGAKTSKGVSRISYEVLIMYLHLSD
jgi:hypothetical protein